MSRWHGPCGLPGALGKSAPSYNQIRRKLYEAISLLPVYSKERGFCPREGWSLLYLAMGGPVIVQSSVWILAKVYLASPEHSLKLKSLTET